MSLFQKGVGVLVIHISLSLNLHVQFCDTVSRTVVRDTRAQRSNRLGGKYVRYANGFQVYTVEA